MLRCVAAVLYRTMRDIDLVARFGGEEFAVVMPRTSIDDAQIPAERAREAIQRTTARFEGADLSVTASIGVAQLRPSEHPSVLLRRADEALYASKQAGRNNTHWHDGKAVHQIDRDDKRAAPGGESPKEQSKDWHSEEEHHSVDATDDRVTLQGESAEQQTKRGQPEERGIEQREPVPVVQTDDRDSAISSELQDGVIARLGDRTGFCQAVRQRLAEWKRGGATFSLILLESDTSDRIVKQLGCGAEQLRDTLAESVVSVVRDMDFVARYSPDCLAIMFPGIEHGVAIQVARRLHQAVEERGLLQKDAEIELNVSLGLVEATEGDDSVRMLRRAEEALRCAKESGNNSIYYHNGQWPEPVGVTAGVHS